MGINCSTARDDSSDSNVEKDSQTADQTPSETVRIPHHDCPSEAMADAYHRQPPQEDGPGLSSSSIAQNSDQYNLLESYDAAIDKRLSTNKRSKKPIFKAGSRIQPDDIHDDETKYRAQREVLKNREAALSFDFVCTIRADSVERRANDILQIIKRKDVRLIYGQAKARKGYGGQEHPRFFGDHFLSNAELIELTDLFEIAREMPKGAHLHIHFNANLLPNVLVDIAKEMDHMYIMSNVPLMNKQGDSSGFDGCKISFSIISEEKIIGNHGGGQSLFDPDYQPKEPMPFKHFCAQFQEYYDKVHPRKEGDPRVNVDVWLQNKLVFQEEETYNLLQTADGAWEKFNGRTQMMKGLFNYETAYRRYTRRCLEEFADDKIQYAEIRPNFMSTNQVWLDDGSGQINNEGIMNLIMSEYEAFQIEHKKEVLKGLKIIYCTPRSFERRQVADALSECFEFYNRWPGWIAGKSSCRDHVVIGWLTMSLFLGFDLVGEESKGKPLSVFVPELLRFKERCTKAGVEIPFLFHCGETLSIGTATDENLFDALLLGSKRIGHGFALPRHPYVLEQMKARNICVEVCPISNEILGLTPRMSGHSVYSLLAHNVHCTISTDNGTLFRYGTHSHPFILFYTNSPPPPPRA